jgi:hypothetical protein
MEVKGTAVKSIPDFIKSKFPEKYDEWFNNLPENSKKIFAIPVFPSQWYDMDSCVTKPTEVLGKICFANDIKKGAWECGRFSAETALQGIYKFFVKAASPSFIMSRASKVFATYYQPSDLRLIVNEDKRCILHITLFEQPNALVEYRIAGWMEKALELSGMQEVVASIPKSLTQGDKITEIMLTWS